MQKTVLAALVTLLATAGSANAQYQQQPGPPAPWHGCNEDPHGPGPCACTVVRTFYRPGAPWNISHPGGPGIRVTSPPVYVASGSITIQGPPIWIEAPPIHVAPVQINLRAPQVYVKPSDVTVAPPQVNFGPCEDGGCNPPH